MRLPRNWRGSTVRGLLGLVLAGWLPGVAVTSRAQPPEPPTNAPAESDASAESDGQLTPELGILGPETLERLAEQARQAVVVITTTNREGRSAGVGSGFIVTADGLVATNQHVIGEARPIQVQLADGRRFEVEEVHASDWRLDLALVKISAENLPTLALGDAATLRRGQPVVALGNPLGLRHSVVAGVVSATREIDGRPMIQLAIPVEPGNSGGPVLDLEGRVVGLLTTKSAVTANLGFAVTINQLRPLLERPNPVPIERWLLLGALDEREWQTVFGGRWRRRAGQLSVSGWGESFGGRSLCLWQGEVPPAPYEVAVSVRLDDESGAAGLVFAADGRDRHWGFYPSGGQLRLTRFDGPDVASWTILRQEASPHYQPGGWNTLKLRRDGARLQCLVNDQVVYDLPDEAGFEGRLGLAKFRDTVAHFKQFQVGRELPRVTLAPERIAELEQLLEASPATPAGELPTELGERLATSEPRAREFLLDRGRRLRREAEALDALAARVHRAQVLAELAAMCRPTEGELDLARAALLISRLDNPDVDVAAYVSEIDAQARRIVAGLPPEADATVRRTALDTYLFSEQGFHGNRTDYYTRANSYLDRVIDDREGLPITLAVLYLELARRLELDVVGIPLPGHFLVEWHPAEGPGQLLDVFDRGRAVTRQEAVARVREATGQNPDETAFAPASRRAILVRMLRNLLGVSQEERDVAGSLGYLDATLVVEPGEVQARMLRIVLRHQAGDALGSLADVDWLLEQSPPGIDRGRLEELREFLVHEGAARDQ